MNNILGNCPLCKKGKIVSGSDGYYCNYFVSMSDKCLFKIHKSYFGKEVDESIAKQIIDQGESEILEFINKSGESFLASLRLVDGSIKPNFKNKIFNQPCPRCGGKVEELINGYACENYKDKTCKLYIPKVICGKEIKMHLVEDLLKGGKTPFISGFLSNSNTEFTSRLCLSEDLNVIFNSDLCQCPKCGGQLYVGKKAYNCANYNNPKIKCDFVIWKEIFGRKISEDEAVLLCENKQTPPLSGFITKQGDMIEKKLTLNSEFKVLLT